MVSTAPWFVPSPPREARLEVLFDELAELAGQRNAIDARIVEIVAEIGRDGLWSNTGCRSVAALVAWKLGASTTNAHTITAIAERLERVPALRSRPAGGSAVVGSGRRHRRAGRPMVPMRTTRRWPMSPRSASCAPRSNSNPAPTPNRNPNRNARSAKPATGSAPPGGSPCPNWTPQNSTPRWVPIRTR